jgi:Leucine-rich repeat (LRR) protein
MRNRITSIVLALTLVLIIGLIGCGSEELPEITEYTLTISSTEGGSVTAPGEGTLTYDKGTVVVLGAIPYTGYRFVSWTGDVDTISDVNTAETTITLHADCTIAANFEEYEVVIFVDPNLEAAVRQAISQPESPIYTLDMERLVSLHVEQSGISDLTGLEYATHLRWLVLGNNQISDLSPLANLTNLTWLEIGSNQISDIWPLANLTRLAGLWLSDNWISDISPLASLTNLTWLGLWTNQISDISPLTNLTNLSSLNLYNNQITDISPLTNLTSLLTIYLNNNQISDISYLTNLTNLINLILRSNQISDISPLLDNDGLSQGAKVDLSDNPLASDSIKIYIPQLQERGVTVYY